MKGSPESGGVSAQSPRGSCKTDDETPDISVVIPCLNEEDNVESITAAVVRELERMETSFEIIFIDNGSADRTEQLLRSICARESRVRVIFNNRNYGQMRSPTYGIYQASGRAVIGMCADFQDPPEMLGAFIERWRAGAKIVLGVRKLTRASPVAAIGYALLTRIADYRTIPGATGFGLYDRAVVRALAKWREPEPFFRGMLVESGFRLETLEFNRPGRVGGVTKNNFYTLFSFSLSGLASSSRTLLRLPLIVGIVTFAPALGGLMGAAAAPFFGASPWPYLFVGLLSIYFAVAFVAIGLLGEQIRLIAERTRDTPLVIERERINFPSTNP